MNNRQPFLTTPPQLTVRQGKKSNGKKPLFSILIPSWNNLPFLKTCVASLRKNSYFTHQIILHLNVGTDGSREWAEQEGLSYTHSTRNIGICYAMNVARSLVTTEYVVYFNDDMYACPDWDYWLYEEIKRQTSPLFFLSATLIEPRYTGNACVIAPFDVGDHPDHFDEATLLENCQTLEKADWQGATWPPNVVPLLLWDMVGGYSIEFSPGMYSDPDFAMKLWHAGVRDFKGVSKSRVYHFMSKSTGKLTHTINGSNVFLQKWGITSNLFSNAYLHRGKVWLGRLSLPADSCQLRLKALLCDAKRRLSKHG